MKRRAGFTIVEVMVSLGVMTIGAMALIGMQQQTTRANVHAREMTTAMQIAQTWIERLKLDGTRWINIGNSTVDLTNTVFLGVNGGSGTGNPATFTTIVLPQANADLVASGISNAFDYYGRDVPANATNIYYCASYRLTWVYRNITTNGEDRALRADVRVWWANETGPAKIMTDFPQCADNDVDLSPGPTDTAPPGQFYNNYHVVYLSTVIRPMR